MEPKDLALQIARIALDKHALNIEIIDLAGLVDYADYVVICSGRTDRQTRAIAEAIQVELKRDSVALLGAEGLGQGQWVLLDYGMVIVHVFQADVRSYYDLEGLWLDARRVPVEERPRRAARN